ncbi:hypothetical protein SJPD1_2199 [Sulfurospirillum diekertiae]|uniref:Uncharacterized protein n=1 Tax=Sulfurospirillum diekertiae TaxID=1854492 RepID=A0A290HFU6_9BACT|nr:hypothetical protein [Sulfurospirillum diekertiae]ATB70297.1 hypothetical protein SJPD1_2199 [Sulfurospirillum diekertiae]
MIINTLIVLVGAYAVLGYFSLLDHIGIFFQILIGLILTAITFFVSNEIDAANTKARRKELTKKIPLFNTSDIGRSYIALGMVEGAAHYQDDAVVKCLEQALEMDAHAIVNFQLATTTSVYGNAKNIDSRNAYFYTGTAVKYK